MIQTEKLIFRGISRKKENQKLVFFCQVRYLHGKVVAFENLDHNGQNVSLTESLKLGLIKDQ